MEKKTTIIIIAIVAIIAIAGAVGYLWYNAQYDDNIVKASAYQKIALEAINNDFEEIWEINGFTEIDIIKKKITTIQKDLDEYSEAIQKVDLYLNNAKKYAKNDVEKEYIDLLLKKNEGDKKASKASQTYLNTLTEYVNGKIGLLELNNKTLEFQNKSSSTDSDDIDTGSEISALLGDNPDFKQHLKSLNLDETYL